MIAHSELTRIYQQGSPQEEALYRAANNDLIHHQGDSHADAIRAAYPLVRINTYFVMRKISPAWADEFDAWCLDNSLDPEPGFIHHTVLGFPIRRQEGLPVGQISDTNWFVMNIANPTFRLWCKTTMVKTLKGIRYGTPGLFTYPPALNAIMVDLIMHYAAFDGDNNEMINTSDEFAGNVQGYIDQIPGAFIECRDHVQTELPGTDVYANFGDASFAQLLDANTQAIIAECPNLLCLEHAVHYAGLEPTASAETSESRWALADTLLNGTREIMWDGYIANTESQSNKDRAKVGHFVWMTMAYKPGMIARFYYSPEDAPEHISTWEDNALLRAGSALLGEPVAPRYVIPGGVTGTTYARDFDRGRIVMHLRKTGQSGSETVTLPIPAARPVAANGALGSVVTSVDLTIGEAAILVYDEDVILIEGRASSGRVLGRTHAGVIEGAASSGKALGRAHSGVIDGVTSGGKIAGRAMGRN